MTLPHRPLPILPRPRSDLATAVGREVRQTRLSRRCSLARLAAVVEVTEGCLSRLETGRSLPGLVLLDRVARALQVPMRDFFVDL